MLKFCISTVSYSILINGAPAGFFPSQRGLRQEDPLSPFLFFIAMEGLNDMLKVAQTKDWIKGFKVSSKADSHKRISHLQYADDTLVFCEAKREQVKKSYIYPVNEVLEIQSVANILGERVGELPTVYLGMSLGAKSKSKAYVVKRIDALRRKFLWKGNSEKKKFHLVRWNDLTISKKAGGLGIKNLRVQNQSLMMKWLWKLQQKNKPCGQRSLGRNMERKGTGHPSQ
ncbi:uncharacterized protein LOC107787931 [Nicotiana tabacum]|uniref:Uncharacterized protein LOC107787931 n=1 Tax=Nicotiana tabacum TaxID=4097 RepID=A0A1S3ZL05_TOBAC